MSYSTSDSHGGQELSEQPAPDDDQALVDLVGLTLDRIRRLCGQDALEPDELTDRPVLRQALLRVQQDARNAEESFAGFQNFTPG